MDCEHALGLTGTGTRHKPDNWNCRYYSTQCGGFAARVHFGGRIGNPSHLA